jgi:hypothetical protein
LAWALKPFAVGDGSRSRIRTTEGEDAPTTQARVRPVPLPVT